MRMTMWKLNLLIDLWWCSRLLILILIKYLNPRCWKSKTRNEFGVFGHLIKLMILTDFLFQSNDTRSWSNVLRPVYPTRILLSHFSLSLSATVAAFPFGPPVTTLRNKSKSMLYSIDDDGWFSTLQRCLKCIEWSHRVKCWYVISLSMTINFISFVG